MLSLKRIRLISYPRFRVRRGSTQLFLIGAIIFIALIASTVWYFSSGSDAPQDEPMLATVTKGLYELVVVEQGEVESSNNVEIRCEVKARGTSGTPILEVIPEGTHVEVGDLLVRLDASALERDRDTQQIAVNTSYGALVQSENTLEASKVAREEYLQGAFKQEEQGVLSEIFVAEENLKRAQLSVESGERLASKGLVTTLQLDGDRFAVEKARNELEAAQTKLRVLREFTRKKMLIQFDSDIKTAEVKYENDKKNHEVETKKLAEIVEQVKKCEIHAPQAGQVVYANIVSSRGGSAEFVVEAGAIVREQQVIVRLPDPRQMQVKAKINESRITLVKPDMPVSIRIEAFGEGVLEGKVIRVNQYAEPSSWYGSQVKEYATFVDIAEPPVAIRPGLTAEVRIHIERRADTLQIPVQALYDYKNHTYCLVKKGDRWETREVSYESSNDKSIALKPGILDEGEQVVLNPRKHSHRLTLPDLPDAASSVSRVASKSDQTKKAAPSKDAESKSENKSDSKPTETRRADANSKGGPGSEKVAVESSATVKQTGDPAVATETPKSKEAGSAEVAKEESKGSSNTGNSE